MRSFLFLVALLMLTVSCKKETAEKPGDLIPEAKMEAILYELAILNSAKGFSTTKFKEKVPGNESYIFERYGVDSAQFANSSIYYASDPDTYIAIYEKVTERLRIEKETVETARKTNDSLSKISRDSLMNKRNSGDKNTRTTPN